MTGNDNFELDKSNDTPAWYLLPIFLGFVGGIIMFFVLRKKNFRMAKIGAVLGIIMTFVPIIVSLIFTFTIIQICETDPSAMSQCRWFEI